jgi:hypothetical protein
VKRNPGQASPSIPDFALRNPGYARWIATAYSIAAGLPLLALSFLMLAPLFIWFAPDMTRKELTDFVGEKVA